MSTPRKLKQSLSAISRLWDDGDYDKALAVVESLLESWPGNAHLHILWASLVQLQEEPKHDLEEAKEALQRAVELDKGSPTAVLELGHYLDNVQDDPEGAAKAYAEGVATARNLLIEGLIGQAKAYRQLDRKEDFLRCVLEVLQISQFDTARKRMKADAAQLKGRHAEEIQDLFGELITDCSA